MRAAVVGLVLLGAGCASTGTQVANADLDRAAPECRGDRDALGARQRELTFRWQRIRQTHARGLSASEDEATLARELRELRAQCELDRAARGAAIRR